MLNGNECSLVFESAFLSVMMSDGHTFIWLVTDDWKQMGTVVYFSDMPGNNFLSVLYANLHIIMYARVLLYSGYITDNKLDADYSQFSHLLKLISQQCNTKQQKVRNCWMTQPFFCGEFL